MRKIASLVAAASPRLDPVSRRREETTIAHEVIWLLLIKS